MPGVGWRGGHNRPVAILFNVLASSDVNKIGQHITDANDVDNAFT